MINKITIVIYLVLKISGMVIAEFDYRGENFPVKYLIPEKNTPTKSDLDYYLNSLKRTVDYFSKSPNNTDGNKAFGLFYMKVLLKRTLRDYYDDLKRNNRDVIIKNIINQAENVVSHFIYTSLPYGWRDIDFRVSRLFKNDEPPVYSIRDFNRNRLKKWIYEADKINDFHRDIDDATLSREVYVDMAISMDRYFRIQDSDLCLSRIVLNPEPVNVRELQQCGRDPECENHIYATPSVAYALSHRLVNLMALRHLRRCYINSEKYDDTHMDKLCSHMYRETVYLARRGYFIRDLFLEHIALCSMLGYEEFHRRDWFHKSASWVDENGCMYENRNFVINSTKILLERATKPKRFKKLKRIREWLLNDECQNHPMAMVVMVLAHGIRHAAHFLSENIKLENTPILI